MVSQAQPEYPAYALEQITYLAYQLGSGLADRIWTRQLTDEERIRARTMSTKDIIEIYSQLKGITLFDAVIELARKNSCILPDPADELRRQLGLSNIPRDNGMAQLKPHLGEDGFLRFRGERIRKIALRKKAITNIEVVLRAFQAEDWAKEIKNPLPQKGPQCIHDTLKSLRRNLRVIGFSCDRGGTRVLWYVIELPVNCQSTPRDGAPCASA